MMSIISLKELYRDMNERFGITFIMCAKLNQDALEGLFALLRARGRTNDHPTPMNALRYLRVIMLGKNLSSISPGQNTKDQCNEEFAILDVLRSIKKDARADELLPDSSNHCLDVEDDHADSKTFTTEDDGFEYLVGAMCRKYKNQFPFLGSFTYQTPGIGSLLDHDYAFPTSYVQHLSLGGLTKPSEMWMNQAAMLEKSFKNFHGLAASNTKNVCQKLSQMLKVKYPHIPSVLVDHFVRHRTYIRVETLNKILKQKKLQKNSVKRLIKPISAPLNSKQKKMKKVLF